MVVRRNLQTQYRKNNFMEKTVQFKCLHIRYSVMALFLSNLSQLREYVNCYYWN